MARTKRVKKQPTAIAPDGSVQQGVTQKEFDDKIKNYEEENKAFYEGQRSRKVGNTTADEIFKQALDKFSKDPSSFSPEQITALKNAGVSLGYGKGEQADAAQTTTPTQTTTPAQQTTPTPGSPQAGQLPKGGQLP